jgi:hypothetical protein
MLESVNFYPAPGKPNLFTIVAAGLLTAGLSSQHLPAQEPTFAGNAQHTAVYDVPAQPLNRARWTATNDFNAGSFAHYGAPVITVSNTVVLPVNLSSTGFKINVFDGAMGRLKYSLTNDYTLPSYSWEPVYQPVLAQGPSSLRLYYAGGGGTVYYIDNPDSDSPGAPVRECFYTNLTYYASNAAAFNSRVFLNTPITADTNGVIFFGFRVEGGTAPAPLNTTNSGFARIDPAGNAIYVLAGLAAADALIYRDSHNCAPALSNDGSTLYVAVKGPDAYYSYLLGLDSTTLATKYKLLLRDPRNGNFAGVFDNGTASPMIAPDNDVFFGVMANPDNGRGFMLHLSADLATQKPPSGFGWDYTAAIVPTNMVPSYTGKSPYLLFSKYNNYANSGDGDGINKIALLDPGATQIDPHPGSHGLVEMREVLIALGGTPDSEFQSTNLPLAVREWCINSTAVNPATSSVFAPSEDGQIYRWNLANNSLSQVFTLGVGVGAPYVPTVIGPDGTVYSIHDRKLFALGGFTNFNLGIYSSAPDLRNVVAGQPVVLTAVVTNVNPLGPVPTGTITFQDSSYIGLTNVVTNLAVNVPLVGGTATITNSTLSAGGIFPGNYLGNHFITAIYSGDTNFSSGSATLVQKVHANGSVTAVNSVPGASNSVSFAATVSSSPPGGGTPTGLVSFWDHAAFLGQVPLTNGATSFRLPSLSIGSHAVSATYNSDTTFATSSGNVLAATPFFTTVSMLTNGACQLNFSNSSAAPFDVLASGDMTLDLSNWAVLGLAIEVLPGQFNFTDYQATNNTQQQFYRVRSP